MARLAILLLAVAACRGEPAREAPAPDARAVVPLDAAPDLPPGPPVALVPTRMTTALAATDPQVLVRADGTVELDGRRLRLDDPRAVQMLAAIPQRRQIDLRIEPAAPYRIVTEAIALAAGSGWPTVGLVMQLATGEVVSVAHPLGLPGQGPSVNLRLGGGGGPDVEALEARHRDRLLGCYEREGALARRFHGVVAIDLALREDGYPSSARGRSHDARLGRCVEGLARTWHLSQPPARTLTITVGFAPGDPPPCEPPADFPVAAAGDLDAAALALAARCPGDVARVTAAPDVPYARVVEALVALIDDPTPGARRMRGFVLR